MKKILSLISAAVISLPTLLSMNSYAADLETEIMSPQYQAQYRTFEELMDISGEQLQAEYGSYYGLDFLDMDCTPEERVYEFLGGDSAYEPFAAVMESSDTLVVKCTPEQNKFIETLKIGSDLVISYFVDDQHDLESNITPEYFGLPADWEMTYDKGTIKDGKYYLGNSYNIVVPNKIAVDYSSFIRLYLQQKLFDDNGKFDECHVSSYMKPFDIEPLLGYQPMALGDTDYDGVRISDAVRILSFSANSEKYPMTIYTQRACDVYNNGDGIDSVDSLTVQKYITNIIAELPESYLNEEVSENIAEINVYDYSTNQPVAGTEVYVWATYGSYMDVDVPQVEFDIGRWTTDGKNPITIKNLSEPEDSTYFYIYHVKVIPPDDYTIAVDGQDVWTFDFTDNTRAEVSIPLACCLPQPATKEDTDPENYAEINVYNYETGELVPGAEVQIYGQPASNTQPVPQVVWDMGTWVTDGKETLKLSLPSDSSETEDRYTSYMVIVTPPEGMKIAVDDKIRWSFDFLESSSVSLDIPLI